MNKRLQNPSLVSAGLILLFVLSVPLVALADHHDLCGDVNFDQQVNVVDIVKMVSFITDATNSPTADELMNGDANCDKIINVVDIVHVINNITGEGDDFADSCWEDEDGDGWDAWEDCDDTNDYVSPDECEEPENGLDDDCNPLTSDTDILWGDWDCDGYFSVFVGGVDCDDDDDGINIENDMDLDCVEDGDDNCPNQYNPYQQDVCNNVVCSGGFNEQKVCDDPAALNYCYGCDEPDSDGNCSVTPGELDDCLYDNWRTSVCAGCIYTAPSCSCAHYSYWPQQKYQFRPDDNAEAGCSVGASYDGEGEADFNFDLSPFCFQSFYTPIPCNYNVNPNCAYQPDECQTDADCPGAYGYCITSWENRPNVCGSSYCSCSEEDPWAFNPPPQCDCTWDMPTGPNSNVDGNCEAGGNNAASGDGTCSNNLACNAYCNACNGLRICNGLGDQPFGAPCQDDDDCKGVWHDNGLCGDSFCNTLSDEDRVGQPCSILNSCGNAQYGGRCIHADEDCCNGLSTKDCDEL